MLYGQSYEIAKELEGLLSSENSQVLADAQAIIKVEKNKVVSVHKLTLHHAGVLNGDNLKIDELVINADGVRVENLTVAGALTLTNNVLNQFEVQNVQMGRFITPENNHAPQVASLENDLGAMRQAALSTRLKVTFIDSSVAYVEIRQDKVYMAISGSSEVRSLSIKADRAVIDSPFAVLPSLKIDKGVTQIELNASIASVVVETNTPVEIGGKGNFNEVVVNTKEDVKISTEGTIGKLQASIANVELGNEVKVGKTEVDGKAVDPSEIIKNIDEVKDNVNVTIEEDNKEQYFVAKATRVDNNVGFITLSFTHAENATIKYEYVNEGTPLVLTGATVSTTATEYKPGDEIIAWYMKEIHVYKVDENDRVKDSFRLSMGQIPLVGSIVTLTGDMLTIKSTFNNQLELEYFYIVDENSSVWLWEGVEPFIADENGIPTLTLKVGNGISETQSQTFMAHHGIKSYNPPTGLFDSSFKGDYQKREKLILILLNHFKQSLKPVEGKNEGFTEWDYYYRVQSVIRELMEQPYTESYYKFEVDEILKNLTDFSSVENVKASIIATRASIAPMTQLYNEAKTALNNLSDDNKWGYPTPETLRDDVTEEDIKAVKELIEALPETADKATLLNDINYLIRMLEWDKKTSSNG